MKRAYHFFFDDEIVCKIIEKDRSEKELEGNKVFRALSRIDEYDYSSIRILSNSVILSNSNRMVKINDFDQFLEHRLYTYLPNTFPQIKKGIAKLQKEKHKNEPIKNIKKIGIKATAAAFAIVLLATAYTNEKNGSKDMPEPILIEKTSDDKITEENIMKPISVDNDYQDMLDELENKEIKDETEVTTLSYTANRDSKKGNYAYDNYYDIVESYATKWGISPNIPMAMLTQESGGMEKNLMQIQFSSWEGEELKVYDFVDGEYKTYMLTSDSSKVSTPEITYITPKDLENPKTNISIGCILIRKSAEHMNFHIGATIQCYNFGVNNMNKVLEKTATESGVSVENLLNDQKNLDFVNYTNIIDAGDPNYLSNVMQYMDEENQRMAIKYLDSDNNVCEVSVKIIPENNVGLGH